MRIIKAKYPKVGSKKFGGLNKGPQEYGSLGANNQISSITNTPRTEVITSESDGTFNGISQQTL